MVDGAFGHSFERGTTPAKFDLIWFSGFRGEDINVKVYVGQQTPNDAKISYGLWPGELKILKSILQMRNFSTISKDLPMIDAQFRFNQCNSFREEDISVFSRYGPVLIL